jgi:hypothetical protein
MSAGSVSDRRSEAIRRWGAALERHDDDEVDRIVRRSHAERNVVAASGSLGPMLGGARIVPGRRPDASDLLDPAPPVL